MTLRDLWRASGPIRWVLGLLPVLAVAGALIWSPNKVAYLGTAHIQAPVSAGLSAPWQATQRLDDLRLAVTSPEVHKAVGRSVPAAGGSEVASLDVAAEATSSFVLVTATAGKAETAEDLASAGGLAAVDAVLTGLIPMQEALVDKSFADLQAARDASEAMTTGDKVERRKAQDKVTNLEGTYSRADESLRSMGLYLEKARSDGLVTSVSSARVDSTVSRSQFLAAVGLGSLALAAALILGVGTWRMSASAPGSARASREHDPVLG